MRSHSFKVGPLLGPTRGFVSTERSLLPRELRAGELVRLRNQRLPLRILRRIDTGSHSVVYAAQAGSIVVAMGVVAHSEGLRRAFALQRLAHSKNVVAMHDYIRVSHTGFWLAEYLPGGALDTLLGEARAQKIRLPLSWRLRWFEQAVDAVLFCHARGIIHYDVTPKNFLLSCASISQLLREAQRSQRAETFAPAPARIKLGDFSLASRAAAIDGRGTVSSLPPEALWGLASGKQHDLFALGCLLFALVLGCEPYDDVNEEAVIRALLENRPSLTPADLKLGLLDQKASTSLSEALATLAGALISRDPKRRPSAQAVRLVLNDLLG